MLKSFFKPNGWLLLFLILLMMNVGIYSYVHHKLNEVGNSVIIKEQPLTQSKNVLILQADMINKFIQKDSTEAMKLNLAGDQLAIQQKSSFIGQSIQTNILTTPTVIGHNQLRLKIQQIKVANLPLTKQQTINLVKNFGDLPSNVKLDAKNQCFYYTLKPLKLGGNELILTSIDSKGWHFNVEVKEE